MTTRTRTLGWTLAWATVAGVLMGIVGLFAFDGLPSVSAQSDTTAPTISSVAITSDAGDGDSILDDDGVYGIGDSIEVTVTFNETVTVTGVPQLELDIGGTAGTAEYESVAGSTVVFSYTVVEGDSDDDGIAISANKLTLNGAAIKDAADNAANLSHEALSAQTGHQVDGIRPTISAVSFVFSSSVGADGTYTEGEQLYSSAKFSEEVIVTGTPQMGLDFEGVTKTADFARAIPRCEDVFCANPEGPWPVLRGISLRFYYRVLATDSDSDGVAISANAVSLNGGAIKDAAGNDAVLIHDAVAEDSNFVVDGSRDIGGL